jgi:branched-chain amino acid transport system substrate-binding protein
MTARSRSTTRAALAVAVALAGLAATACGTGGAVPGLPPVRLGALVPVSAPGMSSYAAALRAAVRGVNARGGIKGRPVELELCDDGGDPSEAQACARQLAADNVIATVGDSSGFSMVEGPILDAMGVPRVGNVPVNSEDLTLPTAFPLTGGLVGLVAGGLVGMRRRGFQSLFIAWSDTPSGRSTVPTATALLKAAGITLADSTSVPLAASDIGPYVQAAIQSRAQVVLPSLSRSQTLDFVSASRAAGATYAIMLPYGLFGGRDIARLGGSEARTENDIEFSTVPPLSASDQFPAIRRFTADLDAELARGDAAAAADERRGDGLVAWLSVQVVARLASQLGLVNASSIWGALLTNQTVDTLGLTAPWTPRKAGPSQTPRLTNLNGYLVTQRGGVETLADPTPLNPLQTLGVSG